MLLKTPKWWKNINFVAIILLPISALYLFISVVHYMLRGLKQQKFDVKIICVGNRVAGGSGKTPFVAAISQICDNVAVISRGYGGASDEAQILQKHAQTYVSKNRKVAIKQAIKDNYSTIILDDGMQDSSIKKSLTIELVDDNFGYGNNLPIPSGPVRSYIKNSDVIIKIGRDISVKADYSQLDKGLKYIAFAGLANNSKFFDMLKNDDYNIAEQVEFADHHNYNNADLQKLKMMAEQHNATLVCTEKDIVKLPDGFCRYVPISFDIQEVRELLQPYLRKL